MEDKVVLVTGSSAGIGEATAKSFARLGCKLVIHGTDEARLREVGLNCKKISPKQYKISYSFKNRRTNPSIIKPLEVLGDVRDRKNVERLIEETLRCYNKLDVLINNVGVYYPIYIYEKNAYDSYTDQMKVNLDSVVLLTSMAVAHLKKSNGCIVNISSNLSSKCIPGGFAYSTAKAALTMFTKSIAVDLAPHVRVNSISPGPIATLMSTRRGLDLDTYRSSVGSACLVGRVGEPDEVARLAVFLASHDSGFITGSDFLVDGGSTIKPDMSAMGPKEKA